VWWGFLYTLTLEAICSLVYINIQEREMTLHLQSELDVVIYAVEVIIHECASEHS
jgi:hypothetical protein